MLCQQAAFPRSLWVAVALSALLAVSSPADAAEPWPMHTIDNSSDGADGVRLLDINADGLLDIATGWEEGGVVRAYLHPGHALVKQPWPRVEAGAAVSVEDAVFADLDGDGHYDILSSSEGQEKRLHVHWAPATAPTSAGWVTQSIPAAAAYARWMFSLPLDIDGQNGIDWVAGAKDAGAAVGYLLSPPDARQVADWRWVRQYEAGWIMSLVGADIDHDGDIDLLVSDRKGGHSGVLWLQNPGPDRANESMSWKQYRIGPVGEEEVMFLDYADLDGDGNADLAVAIKDGPVALYRREPRPGSSVPDWTRRQFLLPADMGSGKAAAIGDIDGDGVADVVISCEHATPPKSGLRWFRGPLLSDRGPRGSSEISGPTGVKFDRIELLDLDGDGDLDVLTCEEVANLGVIWFENPRH